MATVVLAACAVTLLGCGRRVDAAEWPLASLVPADVGSYSELNLDRTLGKTPETAALAEAFGKMQSLKAIRGMVAQNEELAEGFNEVMEVLEGLSEAVGPRVGWAVWMPDPAAMMSEMMGGMMIAGGTVMPGGMPEMPKVLVVADVRDAERLEELIAQIVSRLEIPNRRVSPYEGAKVMELADGEVALGRGEDWLALGFPADVMKAAVDRATGKVKEGSLADDAGYQRVLERLPRDAVLTEYISAESVKRMVGMVKMIVPSAEFSYESEEPLGVAMGVRVEGTGEGRMVTFYATADLNTVPYLIDAPIAMQAAMIYPVFTRSRESAQKAVCLSNIKNLALAMQMWLADHEDEFPKTERWVEELMPYLRNEDVLKCPADESGARSSYALNRAVIGKTLQDVEDASELVVFYETASPGQNPAGAPGDIVSPARHLGGNNFGYADGHAMWAHEGQEVSFEVE
jgi:prepilin-type processing-associated H-X9-DG protein